MKRALLPIVAATLIAVLIGVAMALVPTRPAPRVSIFRTTQPTTREFDASMLGSAISETMTDTFDRRVLGVVPAPPDGASVVFELPERKQPDAMGRWWAGTVYGISISTMGRVERRYPGTVRASGAPVHAHGLVIFPTAKDGVVAFDDRSYAEVWRAEQPITVTDVALSDDDTVVGAGVDSVIALDTRTGRLKWSQRITGVQRNSLAIHVDRGQSRALVYARSTESGPFELLTLDATSGAIVRRFPVPDIPIRRPVWEGDDVHVLTRTDSPDDAEQLRCLSHPSGQPKWQFSFFRIRRSAQVGPNRPPNEMAVDSQRVYATILGGVVAIDRVTGKPAWDWTLAEGRPDVSISSPTLLDGQLFVATPHVLVAFDPLTGRALTRVSMPVLRGALPSRATSPPIISAGYMFIAQEYSVVLIRLDGQPQYVAPSTAGFVAVGSEAWHGWATLGALLAIIAGAIAVRRWRLLIALLSLALCVLTVVAWFKSYQAAHFVGQQTLAQANRHRLHLQRGVLSRYGSLRLGITRQIWYDTLNRRIADAPGAAFCWTRTPLPDPGAPLDEPPPDGGLRTFAFTRIDRPSGTALGNQRDLTLTVPHWLIAALLAVAPMAWVLGLWRDRPRVPRGHCPSCGYDWRITPGQCPECGHGRDPVPGPMAMKPAGERIDEGCG